MHTVRFVGPGRAGRSLAAALSAAGWDVAGLWGRRQPVAGAADGVEALVLSVPDDRVAEVAQAVRPSPACAVLHLSGSLGLDVLAAHPRRGGLHPLVPLPDPERGAARLAGGVAFAVAGDGMARAMAVSLHGTVLEVADGNRPLYHAAASVAANHLVGLMGQVERVAAAAGLPLEAFLPLARAALDDVAAVGPRRALTGPAARGDWATVERHLAALSPEERSAYRAGVALVLRLTVGSTPGASGGPVTGTEMGEAVAAAVAAPAGVAS